MKLETHKLNESHGPNHLIQWFRIELLRIDLTLLEIFCTQPIQLNFFLIDIGYNHHQFFWENHPNTYNTLKLTTPKKYSVVLLQNEFDQTNKITPYQRTRKVRDYDENPTILDCLTSTYYPMREKIYPL